MNGITKNNIIKAYNQYAPLYDFIFGAILQPGRDKLIELVHQLSPTAVLEVGIGTGLTLSKYPVNTKLVGIDLSTEMLALAHKRSMEIPDRDITLHIMNAENMSFPDETFDCIVLPYVLSVTPDPKVLVSELRRVCKTNGSILILNHFSGNNYWRLFELIVSGLANKIGFHSNFSYEENVHAYNWKVESVKSVNLFGLSKLIHIRNT